MKMLAHYCRAAIRNLWRNKLHSIVNITGLASGISVFILIVVYISQELSVDDFHENRENIYRVCLDNRFSTLAPLGHVLHNKFPEVESIVRIDFDYGGGRKAYFTNNTGEVSQTLKITDIIFADSTFFRMFSYRPLYGNLVSALKTPYSIVFTESTATKIFGNTNPVGKTIGYIDFMGRFRHEYTVTAVIKDVPENSSLDFNGVASFSSLSLMKPNGVDVNEDWYNWGYFTYIQLNNQYNTNLLEQKINKYWIPVIKGISDNSSIEENIISLVALESAYFFNSNKLTFIWIIGGIGLLIILVAIINFINLTLARFPLRAKEIGIRKIVGSSRSKLIEQIIGETIVLCFIATLFAILIAGLAIPLSNQLTGKQLSAAYFIQPTIILLLFGGALVTGIIAGMYPAIYLTRHQPLKLINREVVRGKNRISGKHGLIIIQFFISICLIMSTMLILKQVGYIKSKDLGFDQENIISITPDKKIVDNYELFRQKILEQPGISAISASSNELGEAFNLETSSEFKGERRSFRVLTVDPDFVKTMNIDIIDGRDFSWDIESDRYFAVIINETMVKSFGLDPVIGAEIELLGSIKAYVIGVMKDFYSESFHKSIEPSMLWYAPGICGIGIINVKTGKANIAQTIRHINKTWDEFSPEIPLEYHFLDETYAGLYESEKKFSMIIALCSLLAIFIACLGLFGLISFMTLQREKEISIRKVNGAKTIDILKILNKESVIMVLIAFMLSCPVSWFAMDIWLQNYAYRTNISWWVFVLSGSIGIVIVLLTVNFQSLKAAGRNPAMALRYE